MKINGRGDREQEPASIKRTDRAVTDGSIRQTSGQPQIATPSVVSGDRVDIGIAKYISEELNVADMEKRRRERVEELKKLVQGGEYRPDATAVARAVGEEITLEILSAGSGRSKAE